MTAKQRIGNLKEILKRSPILWISGVVILSNLIVYLPLFFQDFSVVYRHYDGPFYMYIAKTLYVVPANHPFHQALPVTYYAAHFPLYPILIRLITFITYGHYPFAMILATIASTIGATWLFHRMLSEWRLVASPVWTTVLFCFFPARWILQHTIGSTEPLFFCMVFGALLAFRKNRDWLVLLCISLAVVTRPPGFLLIPIFGILYLWKKKWRFVFLLPVTLSGLLGLFVYHYYVYGDFLAALHVHTTRAFVSASTASSSLNIFPLEIFRFYAARPNFHSTELYLLMYVVNLMGILMIWKHKELFVYSALTFVFLLFVFNYEITRYMLSIAPFALLIGFDNLLSRRSFRFIVFPVYLYLAYTFVLGFLPLAVCSRETMQLLLDQIRALP